MTSTIVRRAGTPVTAKVPTLTAPVIENDAETPVRANAPTFAASEIVNVVAWPT
jgi:hypothetical protein